MREGVKSCGFKQGGKCGSFHGQVIDCTIPDKTPDGCPYRTPKKAAKLRADGMKVEIGAGYYIQHGGF